MIAITKNWFYVLDGKNIMGIFPEKEIADLYAEGTGWAVEQRLVTITP